MSARFRHMAAFALIGLTIPIRADAAPPNHPWTPQDLQRVAEAALDAAPLAQWPSLRVDKLLQLGDALAGVGDLPDAHSAFMAAAATVSHDPKYGVFEVQIVSRLVRWGFVADADQLISSASDQELKDKLEKARNGISSPIPAPARTMPAEQNADDLAAAEDLLKAGKRDEARIAALRASETALASTNAPGQSRRSQVENIQLLGRIFHVLCEVGEYDQAIGTVQPIENINRRQFYVFAIEAAVKAHDSPAVDHLLPTAVAALKEPAPDWGTVQMLHRMIRPLALAGYHDAARTAYSELRAVQDGLVASGKYRSDLVMIAEDQALVGDLADALTTAEKAGQLAGPPDKLLTTMATVFTFADAKAKPTDAEIAARFAQVQSQMPPLVSGPKSVALSKIAADLAAMGEIGSAIDVEAALEVEPRDVLAGERDMALVSISQAQQNADDPEASLATALRISRQDARFDRLLKLAAVPPRS